MDTTILHGDCLTVLPTLPAGSVQCCVTSPPYWGLRDYGTAIWEGGETSCDHRNGPLASPASTLQGYTGSHVKLATGGVPFRDRCGKCGATRIDRQLGLEATVEEYVETMVRVFRDVRRVLKDDGTLWLNLGDSYSGASNSGGPNQNSGGHAVRLNGLPTKSGSGLKPKDLAGIPWRVALALQADGWYLRCDIIWAKPNSMPESVTDRPTKAHEYIFLLAKRERYYYDADAIKEPAACAHETNPVANGFGEADHQTGRTTRRLPKSAETPRHDGDRWNENNGRGFLPKPDKQRGHSRRHAGFNDRWDHRTKQEQCGGMRNKRSVWSIAPQPYPEAHFATFPPRLIEPCILAGSRPGDTVLDPFAGSGTTLSVAKELNRHGLGIELNPAYIGMAERRLVQEVLPLGTGEEVL